MSRFNHLLDQLKRPDVKAVQGVLLLAKSKLIKVQSDCQSVRFENMCFIFSFSNCSFCSVVAGDVHQNNWRSQWGQGQCEIPLQPGEVLRTSVQQRPGEKKKKNSWCIKVTFFKSLFFDVITRVFFLRCQWWVQFPVWSTPSGWCTAFPATSTHQRRLLHSLSRYNWCLFCNQQQQNFFFPLNRMFFRFSYSCIPFIQCCQP